MTQESPEKEQAGGTPGEVWDGEHPDTHLDREDGRWNLKAQFHDWKILFLLILAYLVWTGVIYFFEPGIR